MRKLKPLPIEAVVRGYLSGSGWKDYVRSGKLFGQPVPAGRVVFEPDASQGNRGPASYAEIEAGHYRTASGETYDVGDFPRVAARVRHSR